ncbi:MAG TPA: sigma-70 family RNA polymerase sigma factor [Patescibacteria group bacterium]|nr:sigma-70 family RNA polymerase sigma factor [Patescibacteria group bacterium]
MDKRHFAKFYDAYVERIYKFVFYRVGANKAVAEDLTQDIFLKAFEAFDRYDPSVSQVSWLYTIARNHLINEYAKRRPGVDLEDIEGTLEASEDLRAAYATRHDEQSLLEAIGRLPSDDGQLIRMKYLEGWSFEDLEEIFEKKSGTLRVQATRALKKLKGLLKDPHSL